MSSRKKLLLLIGSISLLISTSSFYLLSTKDSPLPDTTPNIEVQTGTVSVTLTDAGFIPKQIKVKNGTTVEFSTELNKPFWPASNLHPSHGIYPAFDPKEPISQDSTWNFIFDKAGTWDFHDHLRSYFVGTIYVVE